MTSKGFEQKEQKREKKVAGFENKKAIALFCFFGGGRASHSNDITNAHKCTCGWMASREMGLAGSAGMRCSTSRVSTAITPIGMPPKRARPTTTDLPQSARYS